MDDTQKGTWTAGLLPKDHGYSLPRMVKHLSGHCAVEIETGLEPTELLGRLKKIEKDMGRQETVRWGPRTIDLDILLYDDIVLNAGALIIPHPFMHEREFVLAPLAELAADLIHPVLKKKIGALLKAVDA